ncbi:unnamed protein product, partial [Mycena citricolor]
MTHTLDREPKKENGAWNVPVFFLPVVWNVSELQVPDVHRMEDSEMTKPWVFLSRSLYVYLASFRARRHEFHIRTSQHSCLDPTFSAVCLRWKLNCERLHVRISSHALRAAMRG